MSAEEIQDDPILIAELMKGALEGIARHEYEKGGAGTHGMPHTVVDEALGSSGLRRKDYDERSESDDEVTEEDWEEIRKLLGTQGLRLAGNKADPDRDFLDTGNRTPNPNSYLSDD